MQWLFLEQNFCKSITLSIEENLWKEKSMPFLWQVIAPCLNLKDTSLSYEKVVGVSDIAICVLQYGGKNQLLKSPFPFVAYLVVTLKVLKGKQTKVLIKIELLILEYYSLGDFTKFHQSLDAFKINVIYSHEKILCQQNIVLMVGTIGLYNAQSLSSRSLQSGKGNRNMV